LITQTAEDPCSQDLVRDLDEDRSAWMPMRSWRSQYRTLQHEQGDPSRREKREKTERAQLTKSQDAHLAVGHAVEVIGKVDGNLAIKVQAATDFGTNIGTFGLVTF
jgi:hypothetical protein